ncbi:MAG: hypothetical protein QM669_12430 [Siphonobacter sp.]
MDARRKLTPALHRENEFKYQAAYVGLLESFNSADHERARTAFAYAVLIVAACIYADGYLN